MPLYKLKVYGVVTVYTYYCEVGQIT